MNVIFLLAGLLICITIPFWIIVLLLRRSDSHLSITFSITNIYSLSNIKLIYITPHMRLFIYIENIKLTFTWLRLRLHVSNSNINIVLIKQDNTEQLSQIKTSPRIYESNNDTNNNINGVLTELFNKHNKSGNKLISQGEIENINNVLKKRKLCVKDKLLLFLLEVFDLYLSELTLNVYFSDEQHDEYKYNSHIYSNSSNNDVRVCDSKFFHQVIIRKIIFGFVKSKNKNTEVNVITAIYECNIYEYNNNNATQSGNDDYICHDILHLPEIAVKIKFTNGFYSALSSLANTISVTVEIGDVILNISTKAITNIFQIILNTIIILNNNIQFKHNNNTSSSSSLSSSYSNIEHRVISELNSKIKKMRIKTQHTSINIYENNFAYKTLIITSNEISIDISNILYSECDNITKTLKLLSSETILKFTELTISRYSLHKPIISIPLYSINISHKMYYKTTIPCHIDIQTRITSHLSECEVILTSHNLNKIMDIVLTIVDGIDSIEHYIKKKRVSSSLTKCYYGNNDNECSSSERTNIDFTFNKLDIVLYSNDFMMYVNDVSLKLSYVKDKHKRDEIVLDFSPINVSFTHNQNNNSIINNYYVGHALIQHFTLSLSDNKVNTNINLIFNDSFVIAHDFHLMYIMKFVSEITASILQRKLQHKYKPLNYNKKYTKVKDAHGVVHKKESKILLKWNEMEVVNYLNKEDAIYGHMQTFEIDPDDHLSIPHFKCYHSHTEKYNFTYFLDLYNFYIEFKDDIHQINLLFEDIKINAYTTRAACFIMQWATFYTFYPDWIDYCLTDQFLIDPITGNELYRTERNKTRGIKLTFTNISVGINDSVISQAAILQAKKDEVNQLAKKADSDIIRYLKEIKKDLLTIQVENFTIEVNSTKTVNYISNSNFLAKYYVDTITRQSEIKLRFGVIKASLELHELLCLKDFRIERHSVSEYFNYSTTKFKSNLILFERWWIYLKKALCQSKTKSLTEIFITGLTFSLEDVKTFDKTLSYTIKLVKQITSLQFDLFDTKLLSDVKHIDENSRFNLVVKNLNGAITSIEPVTKVAYNKLDIKIAIFALSVYKRIVDRIILQNQLELSLYYFVFGFDPSQKSGFPLVIMPLCEANFDNLNNVIKVNIPNEISNKSSYSRLFNEIYSQELNKLVMETKSLTLFINFKYLSTFFKIFEIFWEKTAILRLSLSKKMNQHKLNKDNTINTNNTNNTANTNGNNNVNNSKFISNNSKTEQNDKFLLSLFDLKLIYLLEYKKQYESLFRFHPFVQVQRYFGYIFRLYSFSIKYEFTNMESSFLSNMNLLTISFLNDDNFTDEDFFVHDREIKTTQFLNLKNINNFNKFMDLPKSNTYKLLNNNLKEYLKSFDNDTEQNEFQIQIIKQKRTIELSSQYNDLKFDYRHTFAKISNVNLKWSIDHKTNNKELLIYIDNVKLTWNKFNKDVLSLLIFDDVLLIIDRIILKIDLKKQNENNNNNKQTNKVSTIHSSFINNNKIYNSNNINININNNNKRQIAYNKVPSSSIKAKFNFVFEIKNPQICIQNEIKKSTLLLMTKKPINLIISKFLFVDNIKDFKMEIICDYLVLFSAPKCVNDEFIHWIGRSTDNKYYLSENLFGQILETPKIRFLISQQVESWANDEFYCSSQMKIYVDKIKGDFESSYFTDFMNIVEVFLFDRGYSFAEEKGYIDNIKQDMQNYKKSELEALIKNTPVSQGKKPLTKEISFELCEVICNLCEGGKTLIQFLMMNFEGTQEIFQDKTSETHINVRNFHIKNAENNRNDLIFSPLYSDRLGDFEDKINIVTFTKKDRYVSIGTDSLWYELDYIEFNVRPVIVNISKTQIEFIIDFFFQEKSVTNQDEQIKIINVYKGEKGSKKENSVLNSLTDKLQGQNHEEEIPIYFKHFKINETELLLNFEYGEGHPLNIPRTKLKFGTFDKQDKFYSMNTMLRRFMSHCKKQCIKNLGAIISGLFSSGNPVTYERKKKDNDDENHRKLLFGNK